MSHRTKVPSLTLATLTLMGSFSFAFLLGEAFHEAGHLWSHLAFGHEGTRVYLDPFGASRTSPVLRSPSANVLGATSAAGPMLNLVCALLCFLMLRRKREPKHLPLLIWGPVSMVQEGVTFTLGQLTPGGDASWIAAAGVPTIAIILAGVLLLVGGIVAMIWLLPTFGISADQPSWSRFRAFATGIGALMAVRSAESLFRTPESRVENFVPLIFALLLATLVVGLQPRVSAALSNSIGLRSGQASSQTATWALILGGGMFILQLLLAN